jgi:lysophospholipase L1-like esterase
MATLSDSERTTLSLLLRSLSGDVVAIDTLFGVTGGTPPPNAAERASQRNLLDALAGKQTGIDALFGLTPDGSGNLSRAERASVDSLLRALSGDSAALDALAFSPDPTTLAGSANLAIWLTPYRGITLSGNSLQVSLAGGGGVITFTGNLAQSLPIIGIVMSTGALGVATIAWSIDGGISYGPTLVTAATMVLGSGITANLAAGTYNIGCTYYPTVSQWVDQKNGFVFSQATPAKQPSLVRTANGLALKGDGTGVCLVSSTAGVGSFMGAANAPFTVFVAMRVGGCPNNVNGIFSTGQSAAATAFWNFYVDAGNGGTTGAFHTFSAAGIVTPALSALPGTVQNLETWQTGTVASFRSNGTLLVNATAQGLNTAASIDRAVLFGTISNGTPANFGDHYISEVVAYNANVDAVAGAAINGYLASKWTDPAPTFIPDDKFFDAPIAQVFDGFSPVSWEPNDYHLWQPDKGAFLGNPSPATSRRLVIDVPAGVTALQVRAVPFDDVSIASPNFQVSAYVDGVFAGTLTYTGALGLATASTLTISNPGASHVVELEETASIVGVVGIGGTVSIRSATAPQVRVVFVGDSIPRGFTTSAPDKAYPKLLRRSLPANYGVTSWAIPSKLFATDASSGPRITQSVARVAACCDGTVKNIIIPILGTNDYGIGNVLAATFQSQLDAWVVAMNASVPAAKILIGSLLCRSVESANGAGSTAPNYRTAQQAVVTAHSTFCTYFEQGGTAILPDTGTTYMTDGLHPNDTGHALLAPAWRVAILAL